MGVSSRGHNNLHFDLWQHDLHGLPEYGLAGVDSLSHQKPAVALISTFDERPKPKTLIELLVTMDW